MVDLISRSPLDVLDSLVSPWPGDDFSPLLAGVWFLAGGLSARTLDLPLRVLNGFDSTISPSPPSHWGRSGDNFHFLVPGTLQCTPGPPLVFVDGCPRWPTVAHGGPPNHQLDQLLAPFFSRLTRYSTPAWYLDLFALDLDWTCA